MRPNAVVMFERLIFLSLALGLVQTAIGWDDMVARITDAGRGLGYIIIILTFTALIFLGLTLLISRKRSKIALVISLLLFAFGLPGIWVIFRSGNLFGSYLITLLQTGLQIAGYSLLFTAPARAWLKGDPQGAAC